MCVWLAVAALLAVGSGHWRVAPRPSVTEELVSSRLAAFVTKWKDGRTVFRNRCARCHGEDGMDTGYPSIRTLGGIGNRYSREDIKKKIHASYPSDDLILIRGESFNRKDFEALLVFLSGL